jgi:hypothetical protein
MLLAKLEAYNGRRGQIAVLTLDNNEAVDIRYYCCYRHAARS